MQSASFPARQARSHYRHELRTLTYVTLDEANGGVIRNLNHEGVAVQAVGALRVQQRVRLRFELSWLARPISARTLAWLVDSLVVVAALLLFAVIFLSITHELPEWPLTLGAVAAATVFVAAAYWTLFAVFGGPSLGARLAQATSGFDEKEESDGEDRFR